MVGLMHTVPFLTLLILLPAAGALALGLLGFDKDPHRDAACTPWPSSCPW